MKLGAASHWVRDEAPKYDSDERDSWICLWCWDDEANKDYKLRGPNCY